MWFAERLKGLKKILVAQFGICCCEGKIIVPLLKRPPEELEQLFLNKDSSHAKFLRNIRLYNMFSFTSMGGRIDHSINSKGGGTSEIIKRNVISDVSIRLIRSSNYPLLFPYGDNGYDSSNQHAQESPSTTKKKKKLTPRGYMTFRLMRRKSERSVILHGKKLLEQFIVDGYSMVESDRLDYIRKHPKDLRVDLYRGLTDAVTRGETNPSLTGR
ncbi:hypothetical protein K1719_027347 [Acacia pycnantha]|nr:hypothetical protein K1719_027347 [Acacia pycnantha]